MRIAIALGLAAIYMAGAFNLLGIGGRWRTPALPARDDREAARPTDTRERTPSNASQLLRDARFATMPHWSQILPPTSPQFVGVPLSDPHVPAGERTALCVVGELRTFGLPIVHNSLVAWAADLRADVFVNRNAHFSTSAHWGSAQCDENATALALLRPLVLGFALPLPTCEKNGPNQYHHVGHCFITAANHAAIHGLRPYDIFVRVRPDMIVKTPAPAPWLVLKPGDYRPLISAMLRDTVFAVTTDGLRKFLDQGSRHYKQCRNASNSLEELGYLQGHQGGNHRWDGLVTAIVRDSQRVTHIAGGEAGFAYVHETAQQIRANPMLAICTYVGLPTRGVTRFDRKHMVMLDSALPDSAPDGDKSAP
jgi:hypothetical protein